MYLLQGTSDLVIFSMFKVPESNSFTIKYDIFYTTHKVEDCQWSINLEQKTGKVHSFIILVCIDRNGDR